MKSFRFQLVAFYAILLLGVMFGFIDPAMASVYGFVGAVVNVTATVITNRDAVPSVINKAYLARARVHVTRGVCTCANGDSINSTYRFGTVRSNDIVKAVIIDNSSWGAACTMNVGLSDTTVNGGAAVSASLFASAYDMNTAHAAADITRNSGTITVANMEKRVWELLGLAKDPQKEYDVVGTLAAAAAAAGSACIQVEVVPTAG